MIPFPDKKYDIIYADPPWSYSDKGCNGFQSTRPLRGATAKVYKLLCTFLR